MKALMAIAEREIKDRWLLLAGALFVGAVPWMLIPFDSSRLAASTGGFAIAILYVLFAALLSGWSVIGRDLQDGRLAFFFSRPAPGWAIFGGKWLAALLLTLASAALTWLLVVPLDGEARPQMLTWLAEGSVALVAAWCVLAVALSHAASVAYRSRSPLLALDLALLVVAVPLGVTLAWPLVLLGRIDTSGHSNWTLALGFLTLAAIPTAAGAVQVHSGRIDKRRGHRAMSLTLWSGIAVVLLGLGLWSHRATHPTITDLERIWQLQAAPRGAWMDVSGDSGRWSALSPAFLVDSTSGRWIRRPFGSLTPVAFSADGRQAVWLGASSLGIAHGDMNRLFIARLDGPSPQIEVVSLAVPQHSGLGDLTLSPNGARLAVIGWEMLDVYEIPSGKHVAAIPSARGGWRPPLRFRDDDTLHAYRTTEKSMNYFTGSRELVEVDIASRKASPLGRIEIEEGQIIAQVTADDRLLTRPGRPGPGSAQTPAGAVQVFEAPSGRLQLSLTVDGVLLGVRLIEGGRLAVLRRDETRQSRLDLRDPDGALLWSTPLPGDGSWGMIGAQPTPETLVVANGRDFATPGAARVVDLSSGRIVTSHEGVRPPAWWPWIPALAEPGSLASRVLTDGKRGFFLMEPGGLRTILAPLPGPATSR